MRRPRILELMLSASMLGLTGCAAVDASKDTPASTRPNKAVLTPPSESRRDLEKLPPALGKIVAAVYAFRDQTGQYKPAPDSSFSTAVSQGAASMLNKALLDSNWFIPVEREGLQNLLTERRIVRAVESQTPEKGSVLPGLLPSSVLLEGGIIAFESNIKTGGAGVKYFGIGASDLYRTDQVTVNLRAVDIRTGRILVSISTTKTIFSIKLSADVFRFVRFKRLLEAEVGYTRNEPAQLCVQEAIEAAVIHLIVRGVKDNHWTLKDPLDINSPVFQSYLIDQTAYLSREEKDTLDSENNRSLGQ
jgi:curli production assembly/transport component CsgG